MLARLRHYLSAAYLLSQAPYVGAPPGMGHYFWAASLALIAGLAGWHAWRVARPARRATWGAVALAGLCALLALGWQLYGHGALSARVWAASLSGLTAYLFVAALLHGATQPARGPAALAMLVRVVALMLWALAMPNVRPYAALAALAALASTLGSARRQPRRAVLAPMRLAYGAALTRLALMALGVDLSPYAGAAFPNPLSAWLHPTAPALASLGWCWLRAATLSRGRRRMGIIAFMGLGLAGWFGAVAYRHLSHGVTGSDPYAYMQMALDLAHGGAALHRFELGTLAERLQIATWPTVPVGYHAPLGGLAASVWPPGWSAALALPLLLGGEPLALWLAPLCHVGAAAVSGWLGAELARCEGRAARWAVGGLTAALMLTSYEGVTRALVPMADAAASLCGAAMFLALVKAARTDRLRLSLVAGLLWGAAYAVRHPQLWLGLGAVTLLCARDRRWPRRLAHVALYGLGAAALALPDLAHHASALGSPWRAESSEWPLIALGNVPAMWGALWRDGWWRRNEWGYLWPWVAAGLVASLGRRASRLSWLALLLGYGGCLLFHLCYRALRLRDLTPLFPWLALLGAWGAWSIARHARQRWPRYLRTLLAAALALGLAARSADTLRLAGRPAVWTFGYVNAAERAGLESLATLTPAEAVIATGLNAGAVTLYAGRETVRPAIWSDAEFEALARALAQQGRPLYALDDGEEMAVWLAHRTGQIEPLETLSLPRMGRGGQRQGSLGTLYRLHP